MSAPRRTVLLPSLIWDGETEHRDTLVVIEDGVVADVLPASTLPNRTVLEELPGTTLLPGLIDCHVHLADWMVPGFLAAGVTTVRDVGNDLDWILDRRERAAASEPCPRILACGPHLDGADLTWPRIGWAHETTVEIATSVAELARRGVDAVKLYAHLDPDQIAAGAEAAHSLGLPIVAHVGDGEALAALKGFGAEVQHLSGVVHHVDGVSGDVDAVGGAEASLTHCPTLVVWDRLARINDNSLANDARIRWVHPEIVRSWEGFPHRAGDVTERMSRQTSSVEMRRAVLQLHDLGRTIVAGSDTPWPYLVPGFSLHDELALLVDAGLTPTEALATATRRASEALGLPDVGRIAPGSRADLLLVRGDPVTDIRALGRVHRVFKDGTPISMADLKGRASDLFKSPANDPVSTLIREFSASASRGSA